MNYDKDKKIINIQELNRFLQDLFFDTNNFKSVEWAEIENGARIKISIDFWCGPFNVNPIKFTYTTSYTKDLYENNLIMSILGTLAKNTDYYFKLENRFKNQWTKIKIYKGLEAM